MAAANSARIPSPAPRTRSASACAARDACPPGRAARPLRVLDERGAVLAIWRAAFALSLARAVWRPPGGVRACSAAGRAPGAPRAPWRGPPFKKRGGAGASGRGRSSSASAWRATARSALAGRPGPALPAAWRRGLLAKSRISARRLQVGLVAATSRRRRCLSSRSARLRVQPGFHVGPPRLNEAAAASRSAAADCVSDTAQAPCQACAAARGRRVSRAARPGYPRHELADVSGRRHVLSVARRRSAASPRPCGSVGAEQLRSRASLSFASALNLANSPCGSRPPGRTGWTCPSGSRSRRRPADPASIRLPAPADELGEPDRGSVATPLPDPFIRACSVCG